MRFRKQVYIYLLSYFFTAAVSFFIISLLTHHLEPRDYGIINLYSSFLIFLMPFISGGILYPVSAEYFKKPAEAYRNYFTNAQVITIISLGIFTVICLVFQYPLARFLKVTPFWIWIMPVSVWWTMINETAMIMTRNGNRPMQFALFSAGKTIVEMALTILLVIGLHWAWQGRLLSAVMAPALLGVFSIYLFYRWKLVADKVDWSETRRIFLASFPFIFERLAVFVLGYSDKYFIDRYDANGTREVGLYGLGSQLATIIALVIISLNSAYQPHLFKKLSEGFKGRVHKATIWYIGACAAALAGMYIAIPLIFRFFIGQDFQAGQPYAYVLCAGYFMWGIYNAFVAYLIYFEKNRQILLVSVIGMVTSLVLNFSLVRRMGAEGAAIANVTTYTLMAMICFLTVRKHYLGKTIKVYPLK